MEQNIYGSNDHIRLLYSYFPMIYYMTPYLCPNTAFRKYISYDIFIKIKFTVMKIIILNDFNYL